MKPINKKNRMFEQVLISIRDDIAERNLKPGDKLLTEREMSERLQVSRASIREALRILETFDVIQSKPGGGTILKKPQIANMLDTFLPFLLVSTSTAIELLETRRVLEGGIAKLAAMRRKQEDIQQMQQALEKMKSDDLEEQIQADLNFHYAMAQATYNHTLSDILFVISDIVARNLKANRVRLYVMPGVSEELYHQHAAILEAIVEGNGDRAQNELERNLDYTMAMIKKVTMKI